MRGLDIRVAYALNKIGCKAGVIAPQMGVDTLIKLSSDAQAQGVYDYLAGRGEPPALFLDEPELVSAWRSGWQEAAETGEMAECLGM